MNTSLAPAVKAALFGIGVVFISAVISFFASSDGVSINTQAWPPSAKAILNESPSTPLTPEQWKRIDRELAADPNQAKPSHLIAGEIRNTWFIFVALSVLSLLVAHRLWKPLSFGTATALLAPTVIVLVDAFQHVHPYYR
jgi:hypothetical protein